VRLNADIIFDDLSRTLHAEFYGSSKKELSLKRPMLCSASDQCLEPGHVYISVADRLPQNPSISSEALVICIGGEPAKAYRVGKCACIVIKDNLDLFTAFNMIQAIYDKYEEWQSSLQSILDSTDSIQDLVDLSFPIFETPILVLDSDFKFLAYSGIVEEMDEFSLYRPDTDGSIGLEHLVEYLDGYGSRMSVTEPIVITLRGVQHLCFNLYSKGIYAGSVTVAFLLRDMRDSDCVLVHHFASVLERSFDRHAVISSSKANHLKSLFGDLINHFPVDSARLKYLKASNLYTKYLCMRIKLEQPSFRVPAQYICNILEGTFKNSVAFEHQSAFVAFIDGEANTTNGASLSEKIEGLLLKMHLKAGISSLFADVALAPYSYRQACIALDSGAADNPESCLYNFEEYALSYMASSCTGEFPLELLMNDGMLRILEHDATSETSYLDTLRVYLNNNMKITKSAQELFLHRTSLIQRIKRIERLLQMDLSDPNQRLRLLMTIKAIDVQKGDTYPPFSTGQ
jgi:hypothetical protein